MELQYQKAMQENGLTLNDLNHECKVGITEINKCLRAIALHENSGKKPTNTVINKIKTMDKWVYYEILDMLQDTDNNEEEIPYDSKEVIEDIKEEKNNYMDEDEDEGQEKKQSKEIKSTNSGLKINEELNNLYKQNKIMLSLNEIKSQAPNSYSALFEVYEPNEENGIETKSFRLIEVGEQQYKLTKI